MILANLLYRTIDNVYLHANITPAATPTRVRVPSVAAAKYMDAEGEKIKRFRVHVVQELYQTERDYVQALEFTVNVRNHSHYMHILFIFRRSYLYHTHTYIQ